MTNLKINEMQNIGHAKYVVNFYTGKTHPDGSEFYDIAIFSNKKKKDRFVKELFAADARQQRWISTVLANDETSTDEEMYANFVSQGVPVEVATAAIARRKDEMGKI